MKRKWVFCLATSFSVFSMGTSAFANDIAEEQIEPGSRPLSEKVLTLFASEESSATDTSTADGQANELVLDHRTGLFHRQSPSPYRFLYDISSDNDCILMDDRSQWKVNPNDLHKLLRWHKNDILLISANKPWGEAVNKKKRYYYSIINASRNSSVKANLYLTANVHNVDSLNRNGLQIYLSDGTGWRICSEDAPLFQEWETEDTVLVGTYNPWNRWLTSYDAILINVDSNHYVRAKQI